MSDIILNKEAFFKALPDEWPGNPFPFVKDKVNQSHTKIVILDDDPTGTQTVHGLPVLTSWDIDILKEELKAEENAFFILTNSRALTRPDACRLAREIGLNLKLASETTGIRISLISRSDSTLRGHFPHEVDEMARTMGEEDLPYLIFPFFLEGGRFTINDTHFVEEEDKLIPAAQTSYAKDATFGFVHSNLCRWVEEKTNGKIVAENVISISIEDIRKGGPDKVIKKLLAVPYKGACIVNAVSYKDVEIFTDGLLKARYRGKRFLYRTAASFVRVRTGTEPMDTLLSRKELVSDENTGGLFIVGSYVPKTTAQVEMLIQNTGIYPLEIRVDKLLSPGFQEKEIANTIRKMNTALTQGKDTLVYTSRNLVLGDDPEKSLKIGQTVSSSLIKIIRGLSCTPRYLVAKGGITSSDVATKGIGVKKAMVSGQALPGVPVWK